MRRRALAFGLLAIALLALLVGTLWLDPLGWRGGAELSRALTERGRVAVLGPRAWLELRPEGARPFAADSVPQLAAALAGHEPARLLAALEHAGAEALLVDPLSPASDHAALVARLARYEHVDGLRGLVLAPGFALYAPDPVQQLSAAERNALAVVARALLGGARRPRTSSFPEPLRRLRPVEVMVLLREGTRPRLWRSARGSSLATALMTAAVVARERWQERAQAMGAALDAELPHLDLDVSLLEDDGTIADREPAFIDRVFFPMHGVGYERKGAWHYSLPEATQQDGKGRASRAYRKLFADGGLPEDSFGRHDLRLYRLVVQKLASSPAPPPIEDALSAPKSPDELLGTRSGLK